MRNRLRAGLDRADRVVIVAVRRPGHYIVTISTVAAGVFSSVDASAPVRRAIDSIPLLTDSDWLTFVLMTAVLAIVLRTASFVLGKVFGREPMDVMAGMIDTAGMAPSLTEHYKRRMAGDTGSASQSLDYRVRRVSARDLDTLSQINREVFARSVFSIPLDVIKQRNRGVFEANPLAFVLIEAKMRDGYEPVGMSAVLPLNRLGESLYCRNGGLCDSEVRGVHIAGPGEWSDAVVMFAIGLIRGFRGRLRDSPEVVARVFIDHLTDVLNAIRAEHPDRTSVHVYAQTERSTSGIGRLLTSLGFADSGITTGDGYPLQVLELPTATVAAPPPVAGLRTMLERLGRRARRE
ncbi:hypothetical protein AB0L57_32395 [Nocardia sp. NPDC052254]|uniref:hypothetical protein n=1 Tax=Nocardia sp. NPDC052254 TaxID=3155681 RepID=UPI003437C074